MAFLFDVLVLLGLDRIARAQERQAAIAEAMYAAQFPPEPEAPVGVTPWEPWLDVREPLDLAGMELPDGEPIEGEFVDMTPHPARWHRDRKLVADKRLRLLPP